MEGIDRSESVASKHPATAGNDNHNNSQLTE